MKLGEKQAKLRTARNAKILALRGTMKFADIAKTLLITKGVVSGVCYRATKPRPPKRQLDAACIKRSIVIPKDLYLAAGEMAKLTNSSFNEICREGVRQKVEAHSALGETVKRLTNCERPEGER